MQGLLPSHPVLVDYVLAFKEIARRHDDKCYVLGNKSSVDASSQNSSPFVAILGAIMLPSAPHPA